jgi:hypothetical protein
MSPFQALAAVLAAALVSGPALRAQQVPPSIAEKTRGMQRIDGFVPLYWDASTGKLHLEIGRFDTELLYVVSLPAGVGSNDIGLDRSQLGSSRVVTFQRVGPRVFLVEPNLRYRALSDHPAERRAVAESFASSTLWGFPVAAETGGRVLVDATDFVLRDAHGVVGALARARQGAYRLDSNRSALYLPNTRAFPRNSEIEVSLTFAGETPGSWVREVTPTAEALTVRQRHSFVELPGPGFTPRAYDPRAGYFSRLWYDYAAAFPGPLERRFISRHRLAKRDPRAAVSEAVEPIVYYLDSGVPEPVRTALLDGARWWNAAFEAAGYRNAYRVEILPDTADPMDVRYNVIQWVHRSTRGWSYGASVTDPRTGEIIKGHVSLGSLRVRQDFLIAEGLLAPYATGTESSPEAEAMALARIRQLSAHEVGHTLGLAHNYIASAQGRASVMDYPHPLVTLTADGRIDLSDAYAEGIGEWDKVAVVWGYQDFPDGTDERAALDRILSEARARGLTFLSDQDARPTGSAHPGAHLWDNGTDAVAELDRVLRVRRVALDRFGEAAIRRGVPLAMLEETLVPVYLHHRYQVEAAVKVLGGMSYTYAFRGDGQTPTAPVPAADQQRALEAVLATLRPDVLALPRPLLPLIPPRPAGYPPHRELFQRRTGLVFDAIEPAVAAADLSAGLLFDPVRAARLVQQHALDPALPGLDAVLTQVTRTIFDPADPRDGYYAEIARAVQRVVTERLMTLALDAPTAQVRALTEQALDDLRGRLVAAPGTGTAARAHRRLLAADIQRFLDRQFTPERRPPLPALPPGAPIGDTDHFWP